MKKSTEKFHEHPPLEYTVSLAGGNSSIWIWSPGAGIIQRCRLYTETSSITGHSPYDPSAEINTVQTVSVKEASDMQTPAAPKWPLSDSDFEKTYYATSNLPSPERQQIKAPPKSPVMLFAENLVFLPHTLESLNNILTKLKLRRISCWLEQQRDLSTDRYSELWKIKGFMMVYSKIKEMALKEQRLIKECQNGWSKMHDIPLLSPDELNRLEFSYAQILMGAICTMDQLLNVTGALTLPEIEAGQMLALRDTQEQLESLCEDVKILNREVLRKWRKR